MSAVYKCPFRGRPYLTFAFYLSTLLICRRPLIPVITFFTEISWISLDNTINYKLTACE